MVKTKPVKYSVVDAFAESTFKGNPAAVCLLEEDRDDQWLQALASEFHLPVTCYLTRITDITDAASCRFRLRWFSLVNEVKLCGHAALAAAHTLFKSGLINSNIIDFLTSAGTLRAKKVTDPVKPADGNTMAELQPNFAIAKCPSSMGLIVTGIAPPGFEYDFYSRFFCPQFGVNEDHVCGSAHCASATYWCRKLGKTDFVAYQASPRGGILNIHLDEQNQKVLLRGKAVIVMEGTFLV
uniref:phenazine biosynthesis-like domain-containing protein 1 n=1 Tax=Fragaria vesca subsp. vesca TaxID=101020 RepID=UPI0005C8E1F4|nr:PREDICTED: phenazine biosynthesis-like domain-containing protein 1 [Fragaria vesca subsp. vesca]